MINEEKRKIQEEGFKALQQANFRGGIILATGTGKTWIMIEVLKYLRHDINNILYCCDNRNLRDVDFPNQLVEWDAEEFLDIMDRKCYQSAYKMVDTYYDILLCDEGDYMLSPQYIKLLENNTFKYIIFVSATLEDAKRSMIEKYLPIVYEKNMAEIEGQGVVNEAKLYAVNYMLNSEENRKYLSYNDAFKRELAKEKPNKFVVTMIQQGRKRFLGKLLTSQQVCYKLMKKLYLENPNNKILIFCLLSEQADAVCKYSYHSKNAKNNENLKLFDAGDIRVMSVCGKVDRGLNINGVNKIISEAPGESKTKFTQKSGRGRRLGMDEVLDIYFLIPFYKDRKGEVKPTIVQKWVLNSTKDIGLELINYKL